VKKRENFEVKEKNYMGKEKRTNKKVIIFVIISKQWLNQAIHHLYLMVSITFRQKLI
jgi:hypothetical protein